jgi:uncharacterized protein (DUF58 family)
MSSTTHDYRQWLDPKVLDKLGRLELKARQAVEGFMSGMHKSPHRGASVEFAEHREYVPGDDLRHLDWRIYGKSDRFYVKRYEEETNLTLSLVLDCSESMTYAGDDRVSKFRYAAMLCATLAYLVLDHRDAAALALTSEDVERWVPSGMTPGHLLAITDAIERAKLVRKTDPGLALRELAQRLPGRSIVALVSDFFVPVDKVLAGIRALRTKRQDVIVFQVLDRDETEFPFDRMLKFEGLEGTGELVADPKALRQAYLEVFQAHQQKLKKGCLDNGVDFRVLTTDTPLDVALTSYLSLRARARGRR